MRVIAAGSAVHTDGWGGYSDLSKFGYMHRKTVLSPSPNSAHVAMPGVHRVASLVKRWILGTHQGSVTPDHLQGYLEELSFRFNRRTSKNRGLAFRRLLEQTVMNGPVTQAALTHGYGNHNMLGEGGPNRPPPSSESHATFMWPRHHAARFPV